MKSLALNLLKTLLLILFGALLAATSNSSSAKTIISAANKGIVGTTTQTPPSLQAPSRLQLRRHTLPATAATTKPHISTTTTEATKQIPSVGNSRQRLAIARHAAKQFTKTTTTTTPTSPTTIMTNSKRKAIITETSTLESARLVRHIDGTTSTPSTPLSLNDSNAAVVGVRQQRSFYSNGAQPYEDTEIKRKYKTLERRQYTRSYSPTTSTTTGKPQYLRQRTASQNSQFDDSNKLRQSQQSSLPLQDNGLKTTTNKTTVSAMPPVRTSIHSNNMKLTTLHNQQTPKTPRMIQRLVAGHIQNAEGRSTYQVSAVTSNSTVTSSSAATKSFATNYGQRGPSILSSSYRNSQLNANVRVASTTPSSTRTTTTNIKSGETLIDSNHDVDYHDDDEALLDDPGDFDNWDNGILRLSAGSGKENNLKPKKVKEDSKKTLADQVRDGKYGLIEKELFRRTPKRPGVLSYLPNKEVPEDNERNFGGLNEDDIWLAEDHLLVIKGGSLNEDNPEEPWPAIDDYNAAGRQIKIPSNPKIPPPFPVQLEENGPVQLIGNNKLTVVYPVTNESLPIYTIGTETHNTPTTDYSDDEKNLITRPGKTKIIKEKRPSYNNPSPSLPWLYNNQTVASPSLKEDHGDRKPINFPILGPFLYGRNGSLDNINGTEDFDEDDPSLYYPPAYSFVYKSNYSNLVPPGPLVPGIVVPPPPEHFSKLQKSEKERRPGYSTTQSPPIRHRVYSTTTSTPTITTTITAPTNAADTPYRHVVTKISEYTPKIINIVNPSPRPIYTPIQSPRFSITPSTTSPLRDIEPIPVPVAVPIPIYPVNVSPIGRPNIVSFVPTTPEPKVETLSKANPIYYEYFEAKRQQGSHNVIDDFPSTTSKPIPSSKPIKLYATSKKPYKPQGHHHNYLHPVAHNHRYVEENVFDAPSKPEIRYKPRPIFKQRPLHNFEQEVNAIRETLRYYQNQELRDNNIPRTPKAKPVFDYNYDEAKSAVGGETQNQFQPPGEYDGEPFKPMVTYSPAVNDQSAFRALAVGKIESDDAPPEGREDVVEVPKYPTTTLLPVHPLGHPKKLRLGAKYLQQQPDYANAPQRQSTWVAVNKQEFNDYTQAESPSQRELYQEPIQQPIPALAPRNREYSGYYYGPGRQNNRFYEEPFQNIPSRKITNYRPQIQAPQQQQIWSLQNDTLVNELPNRPPINPDAEFIDPYLVGPSINNYPYHQQQQQQRLVYQQQQQQKQQQQQPPPPISHQSQYYARPHFNQRIPNRQFQQSHQLQHGIQSSQQQPPPYSLINDEQVNYRQPLPPINPDSEWITHPQVLRNPQQQVFRPNNYRVPPPPPPAPITNLGSDADVYYLTPKYRRANNLSNNNRYQQHGHNNNNGLYYQNQELRDNNIPRTPKAKPVFDCNYDEAKSAVGGETQNQFQPPGEYDGESFKPMVKYSPAVNDQSAFRALAVGKIESDDAPPEGREDVAEVPKQTKKGLM